MNPIHHEQSKSLVNSDNLQVENGQVSVDSSIDWAYPEIKSNRYEVPTLLRLRGALLKAEYGLSKLDPILLFLISSLGLVASTWLYCRLSASSNLITGLINALGLMVFASQSDYLDLLRSKPDLTIFEAVLVHIVLLAMPTPTVLGLLSAVWPRLISRIELSGVQFSRDHIVFLGVGQRAVSLINACKQSYEKKNLPLPLIVAVDVNETAPAISELKSELGSQFVFIKGDYTFDTTLTLANVLNADRVYITSSDDLTNASAMSSMQSVIGQRSEESKFPDTFIHLSSSRGDDRKVVNPYRFDVRVSASRLFLMMYPPFKMNAGGYLEQHRRLVLVGADSFNERVLQTLGFIWHTEVEQEEKLSSYPSECESFGFTPSLTPLHVVVVDPNATVWVQAMKTRYNTLNDKTVIFDTIDVQPRFLSTKAMSNIGENPLVCYSVEKDDLPVEGLHQIYEVLNNGEIVCASWCRNPTEVIARELDSDQKEVHVRSFGLVDFNPTHKLIDGGLWYDTALRLHKDVYGSSGEFKRSQNLSAVIRYPYLLAASGLKIVSATSINQLRHSNDVKQLAESNAAVTSGTLGTNNEFEMSENLAVLEHTRWLRECVAAGKDRPSKKLWKDLDQTDKERNIIAVASAEGFPMLMADLGLGIVREYASAETNLPKEAQ